MKFLRSDNGVSIHPRNSRST